MGKVFQVWYLYFKSFITVRNQVAKVMFLHVQRPRNVEKQFYVILNWNRVSKCRGGPIWNVLYTEQTRLLSHNGFPLVISVFNGWLVLLLFTLFEYFQL